MIDLLWALLFLGIAAISNWLLGLYDKLGVEKVTFNWKEFLRGIVKMLIIVAVAIGLGFAWEYSGIDLSGAGLTPMTVTTTATIYFAIKAIRRLAEIIHGSGGDPAEPIVRTEAEVMDEIEKK